MPFVATVTATIRDEKGAHSRMRWNLLVPDATPVSSLMTRANSLLSLIDQLATTYGYRYISGAVESMSVCIAADASTIPASLRTPAADSDVEEVARFVGITTGGYFYRVNMPTWNDDLTTLRKAEETRGLPFSQVEYILLELENDGNPAILMCDSRGDVITDATSAGIFAKTDFIHRAR